MAGAPSAIPAYGRARDWQPVAAKVNNQASALSRGFALAAFTGLFTAAIALNSFRVGGFPLRGFAAAAVLLLCLIFYLDVVKEMLRRNALLLSLAAGFAALGIFVSLINGAPLGELMRAVTEVHVQAAMTILVAAILAQVAGGRACAIAIVAVVGFSGLVAVAQMLDISAAWTLRRALGPLPAEEVVGLVLHDRRASGISYSPISLGTHLCLAFAAYLGVRDKLRGGHASKPDPAVILALGALFAGSLAIATRSPILGGVVFLALYSLQRRTSWLPLFLILGGVLLYFAWPLFLGVIETHAPRVVETDDNSSQARGTLIYYGYRLFMDNPLGYGLLFAPMDLWMSYWPDLYTMPAPRGVRENDLHNYVVGMINIYGVGLLLLAPIVVRLLRRGSASLIFFVPYVVHILFHNSGPFYSDNVLWFAIAAIAAVGHGYAPQSASAGSGRAAPDARRLQASRPALRGSVSAVRGQQLR